MQPQTAIVETDNGHTRPELDAKESMRHLRHPESIWCQFS
jgi:hypothetical protein